jgi:hypothetical protein
MITAAEAICKRLNVEVASVKPNGSGIKEIARIVPRNAALEQEALAELAKLTPPASLVHAWRQILELRRRLVAELVKLAQAASRNDTRRVLEITGSKRQTHQKLRAAATREGFTECAQID